jgi:hypothetical protein
MKKTILFPLAAILLLTTGVITQSLADKQSEVSKGLCAEVAFLQQRTKGNHYAADLLMTMGDMAKMIDIEPKIYLKDTKYRDICHLKIVKSANFGDFVSYDGYHYKQIIKHYPQSSQADNAAYELIYIVDKDQYNYADTGEEKRELEAFVKKYPKSDKRKEAKARIKEIDTALKNGGSPILD